MEARWLFTAFDWARFRQLAPQLQAISDTEWPAFDDVDGAADLLEEIGEDATPEEARNALMIELCTVGDGALFESGLPELLTWLRRQRRGEDASEILAGMISASVGIEEWFKAEAGLVGLLNVDEASELARTFAYFRKGYEAPRKPGRIAAITRHFRTLEPAVEHLDELYDVVHEAAAEMMGLAAIRVE